MKERRPLAAMLRLAESLRDALKVGSERIEIAGSIRRQRDDPGDIELVLIPKWASETMVGQHALFPGELGGPDNTVPVNLAQQALERLAAEGRLMVIKPGTTEVVPWHLTRDGKYWRCYLPEPQVKCDIFVCSPATFGLNFMIRTGSGVGPSGSPGDGFAPAMLVRWKQVSGGGYASDAQLHTAGGVIVPTPEEGDVFAALRVRWVAPEHRLSARDVQQASLP